MRTWLVAFLFLMPLWCLSQQASKRDSALSGLTGKIQDPTIVPIYIPDVDIKGFQSTRKLSETPSTIGFVSSNDLQRTPGTSFLPAFNVIPGVRMEERSPDSYRLSIRGSVIAAPFGVQNVKVYWEDIPLTDASGNTYLNVMDMQAMHSAEILKGPAGSMYGAGTGGVLLLHPDTATALKADLRAGSYNQWGENILYGVHNAQVSNTVFQSHNQSDGYRVNSAAHKDVVQDWGRVRFCAKDQLSYLLSYSDLYYQTPGGLTLAEMQADPKADRPSTPTVPGASVQMASITAQTGYAGLTNRYDFNPHWSNTTTLLISGTHFTNPFLTDYEVRHELTLDGADRLTYSNGQWKGILGAEYEYTQSYIHDWGNAGGIPDTTQSNNRLQAFQFNPYVQLDYHFGQAGLLEAGTSINSFEYHYLPLYGPNLSAGVQRINFDLQAMPRVLLQYGIIPRRLLIFASVSRGYSPPTISQIFPGTALLYNHLQPEQGWNYEAGIKTFLLQTRLLLSLNVYDFRMQQSIVPRYDSAGHAYYINAGGTSQKGIEGSAEWVAISGVQGFWRYVRVLASYAYQDYHFRNYLEGTNNYSGNPITGVPRNNLVSGLDIKTAPGLFLHATYTYTSSISLNDAATTFASSYQLLQGKIGWEFPIFHSRSGITGVRLHRMGGLLQFYVGVDNALNQVYSLGNDLNAVGGRYYNPAPARNYYGGISLRL